MMPLLRRKCFAVPVSERNKSVLDPRWERFLGVVLPDHVERVRHCGEDYDTYACANGHEVNRKFYCNDRVACGVDMWRYRENQVADALDIIYDINREMVSHGVGSGHFQYLTFEFTIPKRLWSKVGDDGLRKMQKIAIDCLNEVLGEGGRLLLGGVVSAHYWSSTNPFNGVYPHIHGTLLTWVVDKEKTVEVFNRHGNWDDHDVVVSKGGFADIGVWIKPERMQRIKELWKEKIDRRFGCPPQQRRFKTYNVFFHYTKGMNLDKVFRHLHHRLSYQFRNAGLDIYKRVTSFGYPVGDFNVDWVRSAMVRPKGEHGHIWFGWLHPSVRNKYLAWINHHVPRKLERERERKKLYCPFCGELMTRRKGLRRSYDEVVAKGGQVLAYGWSGGGGGGLLTVEVSR